MPQASEQLINKLWEKMTEIYGHSFTSSFGKADNGTWGKILSDVNGTQMATGLELCVSNGLEWPPNAIGFRKLCLGIKEPKKAGEWEQPRYCISGKEQKPFMPALAIGSDDHKPEPPMDKESYETFTQDCVKNMMRGL